MGVDKLNDESSYDENEDAEGRKLSFPKEG